MSVEQYSLVAHDWLNLEFIINDLTQRVVGQELHPTSSPTFGSGTITGNLAVGGNLGITGDLDIDGTFTLNALTASKLVATDASKGLESVTIGSSLNYTRPTLNTIQDIRTTAVPTFAGMISTGVVRATDFAKTGWPVTPGVTLSFVGGTTRTFTVTDGGSAYYYIDGVKYVLGGNKTVVIDDVEGLWYIYFDGDTLTASQTIWSFLDEDKALVAYLYWARDVGTPANGKSIFTGWELHSFHMSGATHARLHYAGGARWETGLLVSDNEDNTVDVSAGDIWDEDLNISITDDDTPTALFEQILSPAQLSIYYRDGASNWRIYETDEKAALTDVGYLTGGLLQYNDPTTTWSNETVGLNNYVAYYVVATNEQTEPVALIMGQRVDNKLSEAKVNNVFSGLSLDGLPFEEFTVLARLILKDTATYTLEEVLDLRAYNIKGNITSPLITQHAGLGGLNWSSAGHYFDAAVDFNAQNISNIGTVGCGVITQSGATLAATYQPLDDVLTDIAALTEVADNEFIVGTGAGAYAHESGATARTSMGLGTGDSPTFTALTLSTIAAEGTDVDKFLVDSTGVIKYRTGAQVLSDIGGSASGHDHSGVYEPVDAELTSLAALTYSEASYIKMTDAGTFVLRTIGETADDLEGTIDHNLTANYVVDEHIDWKVDTESATDVIDVANIARSLIQPGRKIIYHGFITYDTIDSFVSGSGQGAQGLAIATCSTYGTNNSASRMNMNAAQTRLATSIMLTTVYIGGVDGDCFVFIGGMGSTLHETTTAKEITEKHSAFIYEDEQWYCSVADGATQTIETITTPGESRNILEIDGMETGHVKFRVNGVVVKDFTTNLPGTASAFFQWYIHNKTTADNKQLTFYNFVYGGI